MLVRDDGGGSLEGVGGGPAAGVSSRGWFQIGRASYEIGENSSVGALVTLHERDRASPLAPPGGGDGVPYPDGGTNSVFAADAKIRLARGWFFNGQVAHSRTSFDTSTFTSRIDTTGLAVSRGRRQATRNDLAYSAEFDYLDGIRELEIFQKYLGPDFRAETGFLDRVDLRRTGVNGDFYVRPQNAVLRSLQPILDGYVLHDRAGVLQGWWWSPMIDWKFEKQTHVHTMYDRWMERWRGRDYLGKHVILNVDNSSWRMLTLAFQSQVGDGIFYGPSDADSWLGWLEQYTAQATVRPSPRLTAELTATRNRFSRDHGRGVLYDVWVLGAKTTWQFSRRLYARVYPQVDTDSRHLDADALLGYVVHPGSVIYLGYNGDTDRIGGRQRETGRAAFFKISYVFQR
jgi:hypothetical protein